MFALVDCNNFYCSCERVFDPGLDGRPVVVLSNNDGCIIARSEEAKAIGITMGVPEYMVRDELGRHNAAVFSSNFTLYGDMSERVMQVLASFVPAIEVYSIDEAFLDLQELAYEDLAALGTRIRNTVRLHTGIPVTVGIAATKTLAKIANRFARKKPVSNGVHWLYNDPLVLQALSATPVKEVWGIGPQHAAMLERKGFATAADLLKAPEGWIRETLTVVGHRLLKELKGIPAIGSVGQGARKKNICTSRSFGQVTGDRAIVAEAVSNYAANCSLKLRQEKSCAASMEVFINTNPFRTQDAQYSHSVTLALEVPSNLAPELIRYALKGLDIIFRPGYLYMKCGVRVSELVADTAVQSGLFDTQRRDRDQAMMAAVDSVNRCLGKEIVRFAAQGFEKRYYRKSNFMSPRYTTNINEVLHVKI